MAHHGPMGKGPANPNDKPKDLKKSIGKLITYLGRYKFAVLAVMFFAVGSTVFNIAGPKVLAKATDALFEGLMAKIGGTGGVDFAKIARILIMLLGLYLISAGFQFLQGFIMTSVSQKICYNMRKAIAEKISKAMGE